MSDDSSDQNIFLMYGNQMNITWNYLNQKVNNSLCALFPAPGYHKAERKEMRLVIICVSLGLFHS